MMPTVVSVVGARPQFVKAAVVSRALKASGIGERVVHTGQHYDAAMSDNLIDQLGLKVAVNLGVGSGTHAQQTAAMMVKFEGYLDTFEEAPRCVIVYGDTNSTLAATLVASKRLLPVAHVEAGLRSFNREMPEEVNRVVTDHLSDVLYCSSSVGVDNLRAEGLSDKTEVVGDVMLDAFQLFSREAQARNVAADLLDRMSKRPFALVTLHRPSNIDDLERLGQLVRALGELGMTCLWPVHPRAASRIKSLRLPDNIVCVEPLGYLETLRCLTACRIVVTDSGGLQKEAYWAKRRCITMRRETEWIETLSGGWNSLFVLGQDDLRTEAGALPTTPWVPLYGDGNSSALIAHSIAGRYGRN